MGKEVEVEEVEASEYDEEECDECGEKHSTGCGETIKEVVKTEVVKTEVVLPNLDWKEVISYLEPVTETPTFRLTKGVLTVKEMEQSQIAMVCFEKIVDYAGEPQAFSVNLADFKKALNAVQTSVKGVQLVLRNNELVVQDGGDSAAIPMLETTSTASREPTLVLNASVSVASLKDAALKAQAFSSHLVIESKDGVTRAIASGDSGRLNKKVGNSMATARAMYPLADYLAPYLKAAGSGTFSFDSEKPCKIERELHDYPSDKGKITEVKSGRVAYYLAPRVEQSN